MRRRHLITSAGVGLGAGLAGCTQLFTDAYDLEIVNLSTSQIVISILIRDDQTPAYEAEVQVPAETAAVRTGVAPPGVYVLEAHLDGVQSSTTISTQDCSEPKAYVTIDPDGGIRFDQRKC